MNDTKSDTPQVTHYADDATLAHIAELKRQLAETRRLLVEAREELKRIHEANMPKTDNG
jgi:Mg2+ and Co2+ transporter CorA